MSSSLFVMRPPNLSFSDSLYLFILIKYCSSTPDFKNFGLF